MNCDDVRDALALVAVGDDEPVVPQVVHHLALCETCALAYRRYLATAGRLLDAVKPVTPPAHLRAAIMERAHGEGRRVANGLGEAEVRPEERSAGAAGRAARLKEQGALSEGPIVHPAGSGARAAREASGRRFAPGGRSFRGWAAAALLLAALSTGLMWDDWRARREFARIEAGVRELRAELEETWSAFAGAPAVYAGDLEFQVAEGFGSKAIAEGYLYARPNGWAVLFRIAGLDAAGGSTFDVWLDAGSGWERRGALHVGADGVASWLYYAREPELTLQRVHVAAAGALPGTPEWSAQAVASARVREAARPSGESLGAW